MARIVLINGAPGSGTSTMARMLASLTPGTLAVDIDALTHSLAAWESDPQGAKRHARGLAVELIREQLLRGQDAVVGHYVVSEQFVDELAAVAGDSGAEFREVILCLEPPALAERLRLHPVDRRDHPRAVPENAERIAGVITDLALRRPRAEQVDASGSPEQTHARVIEALATAAGEAG